jgi:hypothetical protein
MQVPIRRFFVLVVVAALAGMTFAARAAEEETSNAFIDALTKGTPTLDMRLRYEVGKMQGLEDSDAFTIRTRLGYGTRPLYGFRAFVELEDVSALGSSDSYNQAGLNPGGEGKTVIADVEGTELNQAYLAYACTNCATEAIVGRQRIILGNSRFVGNVGWRQNEQTYDAAVFKNSTLPSLDIFYGYIGEVYRIFGQENGSQPAGETSNAAEYDSDSHAINLDYKPCDAFGLTLYSYLLDLGDGEFAATQSGDTYGASVNLKHKTENDFSAGCDLEYAMQSDNSASTAGSSFDATYYKGDIRGGYNKMALGVGYEVLGSDNGRSFQTPLATLHKFNGWADVFLVTPAEGLRDTYTYLAATCPLTATKFKAAYHWFDSDEDSITYGQEFDASIGVPFSEVFSVVGKYANYDADSDPNNPRALDVERYSVELNLIF